MRTKINALIVAVLTATLLLSVAGPAAAYPRKSFLELGDTPSFWLCSGASFSLDFDGDRYHNVNRDDRAGGRYTYDRETGKVNLRSGHLDHLFGKLRRGPHEYQPWVLEVFRKRDRRPVASCGPTSYGY